MTIKIISKIIFLAILITSCTKEYDCSDTQVSPAFIGYSISDIDTLVTRKFKMGDNFQTLLDTLIIINGGRGYFLTSNDTTIAGFSNIMAGFDWQLYIPAKNKTVSITNIESEKRKGKRGYGIFSMDPGTDCINNIFSAKVDNQVVRFRDAEIERTSIYIRN